MPLITADDIIDRRANGFDTTEQFSLERPVATTNVFTRTASLQLQRMGTIYKAPSSLPSGVTAINPLSCMIASSAVAIYMLARLTKLGELDISTNAFTAGSVAPSRKEGNVTRQIFSSILLETTVGLNATPGTLAVTYKDENNNTAEASASLTLTANSVANSMQFLQQNSPDLGGIEVTNMVRSGGTSPTGTIAAWCVECIDILQCPLSTQSEINNMLTGFPFITPLGANDEVVLIGVGGSTTKAAIGSLTMIGETA